MRDSRWYFHRLWVLKNIFDEIKCWSFIAKNMQILDLVCDKNRLKSNYFYDEELHCIIIYFNMCVHTIWCTFNVLFFSYIKLSFLFILARSQISHDVEEGVSKLAYTLIYNQNLLGIKGKISTIDFGCDTIHSILNNANTFTLNLHLQILDTSSVSFIPVFSIFIL